MSLLGTFWWPSGPGGWEQDKQEEEHPVQQNESRSSGKDEGFGLGAVTRGWQLLMHVVAATSWHHAHKCHLLSVTGAVPMLPRGCSPLCRDSWRPHAVHCISGRSEAGDLEMQLNYVASCPRSLPSWSFITLSVCFDFAYINRHWAH